MIKKLKTLWMRLSHLPFGKWIFSRVLGMLIPYTNTIRPNILDLRPGFAEVSIKDRRSINNHLASIHALALANLGELTSGLALHFSADDNSRAILTRLDTEYFKKARGTIFATAITDFAAGQKEGEFKVLALLKNDKGDCVAKVTTTWLLGKIPNKT